MPFVGKFGRLGGEWEFFNREGGNTPAEDLYYLHVVDDKGKPISNASVELTGKTSITYYKTDEQGKAALKGIEGDLYKVTVTAEGMETVEVTDWTFGSELVIELYDERYVRLDKEYIFLTPLMLSDDVGVESNTNWTVS